MADRLARFNMATREEAATELGHCCTARAWIERMVDGRPYANAHALLDAAERAWRNLGPAARRDAFRGHPRIGEHRSAAPASAQAAQWSLQEQSAVADSDATMREELAAAQRAYEARFGHIFLICATGLSAEQMLAALRARMRNDPDAELGVAAEEQRKITRLRLQKWLTT